MKKTKLRSLREKAGFSQIELSFRVKIPSCCLSQMENGKMPVFPKYQKALATFFSVEPESLTDDRGMAAIVDE
jgi:transcriptional regulator with XRE-family HTH domain